MNVTKLRKFMTKFYFCGSIRGGRQLTDRYRKLIDWLETYGQVLTEHVGNEEITAAGEGAPSDLEIHDRDMAWLVESDLVIAEVTVPSLGVGYEIARALQLGKTVWCLFHSGAEVKLSAMIAGCPEVDVIRYSYPEELMEKLEAFLAKDT
jgi:hypothetical protein